MKITVFGAGAYGISIAYQLSKNENNNIMLWTENKELFDEFNKSHQFKSKFPSLEVPNNIILTDNFEDAMRDTNLIFIITSAKYVNISVVDTSVLTNAIISVNLGGLKVASWVKFVFPSL